VLPIAGDSITKGVEMKANFAIGHGFGIYADGTAGNAKYTGNHGRLPAKEAVVWE